MGHSPFELPHTIFNRSHNLEKGIQRFICSCPRTRRPGLPTVILPLACRPCLLLGGLPDHRRRSRCYVRPGRMAHFPNSKCGTARFRQCPVAAGPHRVAAHSARPLPWMGPFCKTGMPCFHRIHKCLPQKCHPVSEGPVVDRPKAVQHSRADAHHLDRRGPSTAPMLGRKSCPRPSQIAGNVRCSSLATPAMPGMVTGLYPI